MAYDPANWGVILFGGVDPSIALTDTWLWTGTDWQELSPAHHPPPRQFAAMAYDPATNQLVLFSGESCSTGPCDDTWVWNGQDWIQKDPVTSPVGRVGPGLAYDPSTKQLVMFGGESSACTGPYTECLDTWSWNGDTWTELNTDGPKVGQVMMAYSPRSGTVIFDGGNNANDTQTWAWTGTAWQQVSSTAPCNTGFGSLAPTANGDDMLFGGYGFCHFDYKTYLWNGASWTLAARKIHPSPRSFTQMAYDPLTKQDILFSGEEGFRFHYAVPDDTWAFGA